MKSRVCLVVLLLLLTFGPPAIAQDRVTPLIRVMPDIPVVEFQDYAREVSFDWSSHEVTVYDRHCNELIEGTWDKSVSQEVIVAEYTLYDVDAGLQVDFDGNPVESLRIEVWAGDLFSVQEGMFPQDGNGMALFGTVYVFADNVVVESFEIWMNPNGLRTVPQKRLNNRLDVHSLPCFYGDYAEQAAAAQRCDNDLLLAAMQPLGEPVAHDGDGGDRALEVFPFIIKGVELSASAGAGIIGASVAVIGISVFGAAEALDGDYHCGSCWQRFWNGCDNEYWVICQRRFKALRYGMSIFNAEHWGGAALDVRRLRQVPT